MRKFYNKFFHISKNGKIREEVMLMRVATTIIVMVMCLAAMSFSAYAYFSYSLTTGPNIIEAAIFDIDVSIKNDGEDVELSNTNPIEAELEAGTYEITVEHAGSATTGFVVVTVDEAEYHTQDLRNDVKGQEKITFMITTNEDTKVTFAAYLGSSSIYPAYQNKDDGRYIEDNDDIDLSTKEDVSSEPAEEETTAAESEPNTEPSSAPETESTTEPSTEAAKPEETTKPAETTKPTEASTTEPSAPAEEPDTTQPTEITTTEPADEPTEPIEPAAEDTEITDEPTTEISE